MTRPGRPRRMARAACAVLGAGVIALTAASSHATRWQLVDHPTLGPDTLSLSGNVDGLYPGAALPLPVKVANNAAFDVEVTTITVTVIANGRCSAANVAVAPFSGSLLIRKRATATAPLTITFSSQAPNECQDASFGLLYTAVATRADHK